MINLLPPTLKTDRKYARQNRKILAWLALCLLGIFGIGIIASGGFYFLQQATIDQEASNKQLTALLESQKVDESIDTYKDFASSLTTATSILDRQYLFSNIIRRIGGTLPPGAVLTGVNLTGEDRALDLQFQATNSDTATLILVNLNDNNNGLFEKADTTSISCSPSEGNSGVTFLCDTSIRVLFYDDTDFVLMNALLTEQALQQALTNVTNEYDLDSSAIELVKLDGVKNTFRFLQLYNIDTTIDKTIATLTTATGPLHSYSVTIDGETKKLETPYFSSVTASSSDCPAGGIVPADRVAKASDNGLTERMFRCRVLYEVVINQDNSDTEKEEELKEKDGIDSLLEQFLERFKEA